MFHDTQGWQYFHDGTDQQQTCKKTHRQLNPANIKNSTLESSESLTKKQSNNTHHTQSLMADNARPIFYLPRLIPYVSA